MKFLQKKNLITLLKVLSIAFMFIVLGKVIDSFLGRFGLIALDKDIHSISYAQGISILILGLIAFSILPLYIWILRKFFDVNVSKSKILYDTYMPAKSMYRYLKDKKISKSLDSKNLKLTIYIYIANLILSAILFFITLKIIDVNISIPLFLIAYLVSTFIGFITLLPAGIGFFDLVMLILLASLGVKKDFALIAIIFYRISYFIIPLAISGIIFLIRKWSELNSEYNSLPSILLSKTSFFTLRFLVFLSGTAMLLSTALPRFFYKIPEIYFLSSATELHFSKSLVVLVGFLLVLMAKLIKYRTKGIYLTTILFLILGSLMTILKSFNYIAAGYIIIVAIIVILSKSEFYKKGFVISVEDIITTLIALLVFWGIYLIVGYAGITGSKEMRHHIFFHSLHSYGNLVAMGTNAFIVSLFGFILMYIIGKYTNKLPIMTVDMCKNEIDEFLKDHNGTSLTHLIHLNDKYVFFSSDKSGMIQYARYSNKLVVLGNPLAHTEDLTKLLTEFYDFANSYGYTPIFFEVSASMMNILHDYGYEFMKLGEAAIVHLDEFTLAGQKMQKVRTCCNKINKAGYSFEVVNGDINDSLMAELREISDIWLAGKKEMGFSMGFFDEEYIKQAPIGLVRDENNTLKAFVTTMPTYGENETFCSDLMRYSRETPRGVMDYMFANLLLWGKENGYKYFNFGVSPLANVGYSKYSFLSERFASQIYYHGTIFYSFEGLKKFKGKYAHSWEPKLLAYKNRFSLPITMLQTNLIVSNPKQRFKDK